MTKFVTDFINANGLYAILFLMTVNSCGIPFPSEVIMPFAGLLASTGHFSLVLVIAAGATGNLIGATLAYLVAAKWGEPLLLGPGRFVGIKRSHIETADRWFKKYGLTAVFFGRMLPVICTYISFPAGLAKVRLPYFASLTLLGSIPWCAALAGAGYELGSHWDSVSGPLGKVALVIGALVVIGLVYWLARGRKKTV